MENQKLNRVFDRVKLSREREKAILADLLREKKEVYTMRNRKKLTAVLAAAAAMLLTTSVLAASLGLPEMLADWFGQRWEEQSGDPLGEGQIAFLERLTQPVGIHDTQNGVTIMVDSATVGHDSIWMLLVADGVEEPGESGTLPSSWLTDMDWTVAPGPGESPYEFHSVNTTLSCARVTDDGRMYWIYHCSGQWEDPDVFLGGCYVTLECGNIESSGQILAEGPWKLEFALEAAADTQILTLDRAQFAVLDADVLLDVEDVRVTSTDISFVREADGNVYAMEISLLLRDGTEAFFTPLPSAYLEGGQWFESRSLPLPVDLTQVETLRVGDEVFQLQ